MASSPTRFDRTPLMIIHHEEQRRHDVYGTIGDAITLQGQLLRGPQPSSTVLVATHPIGAPSYLPTFTALAHGGFHVMSAANRYTSGDYSLIMERALLDLGAFVRHAKQDLGYERVLMTGWSGGAALAMTYQAQAENPTIAQTPSGEPCDLAAADLVRGDGVVLIAAHRSRHRLLTEWLDPSIVDEANPDERDSELDLFGGKVEPPYSAEFLQVYRSAQVARNRRITATVRERLADLEQRGRTDDERSFVVHGTMADPRWLDPAVDPNDRLPRHSYLGDPSVANNAPSGLARYSSLRSWLSQWSLDDGQVDAGDAAKTVKAPVLVIENSADDACPPSHIREVFDAVAHDDKEYQVVHGANHYFAGAERKQQLATAVDYVDTWARSHDLLGHP